MKRRAFLKTSCALAATAAGGITGPVLGAQKQPPGAETSDRPPAIEPVADYLADFEPAGGEVPRGGSCTLKYDIVRWNGERSGEFANPVVGSLTISRKKAGDGEKIHVNQRIRFRGRNNILSADIVREPGTPGRLRRWHTKHMSGSGDGPHIPHQELEEEGTNRGGSIRVEGDGYSYEFEAENPVMSQWALPDLLMRAGPGGLPSALDLLHDLSTFAPGLALKGRGPGDVPVKGGRTVRMESCTLTGHGTLPVHYLLDGEGRPQLVTACMLSWGLRSVSG